MPRYVFGPVPSRRLGFSVGVNNISFKHCSYSCVYCQLGRTTRLEIARRSFYDPKIIVEKVINYVEKCSKVDYVTFVPDGEPTLDVNLGKTARALRNSIDVPIAILTNASLLWLEDVMLDLNEFNLVSLKIDSGSLMTWKAINRPHPGLRLEDIIDSIKRFAREYRGTLITETMLVNGVNVSENNLRMIADILGDVRPDKAYISVPTRPPAEPWVKPASEEVVNKAYSLATERLGAGKVELLLGYEEAKFRPVGDPVESLLATVSVHPMRIDYAVKYLERAGLDPSEVLSRLKNEKQIALVRYRGHLFIIKKIS